MVKAAYAAFAHGLDIALGISVGLLVISAAVAYGTGTVEGQELVNEVSEFSP